MTPSHQKGPCHTNIKWCVQISAPVLQKEGQVQRHTLYNPSAGWGSRAKKNLKKKKNPVSIA